MNHETQIKAAQQHRPTDEGQGSALLRGLFYGVCGVISSGQLRMKPREKMFALLLAERSFGIGQEWGHTDIEGWRHRLEPPWRSNEVKGMLRAFERSLWLVSKKWSPDNAWYALCPLQWPGWAAASARRPRQGRIEFVVPEDLNTTLAKISQGQALDPMFREKPPDLTNVCGALRNCFASDGKEKADGFAKFSQKVRGTLSPEVPASKPLKLGVSNLKGWMDTEELREGLLGIECGSETEAMAGMAGILGELVWEGDADKRPIGDGGKWRNRWRSNRGRVHRVMAALVEDLKEGNARHRGARSEWHWQRQQAELVPAKHAKFAKGENEK